MSAIMRLTTTRGFMMSRRRNIIGRAVGDKLKNEVSLIVKINEFLGDSDG